MGTTPEGKTGIVKQILSGDSIVIRDKPKNCRPKEKTIILANLLAPKLGKKRKDKPEEKDEEYAWDAREFLRKKLIGQEVLFVNQPVGGGANKEGGKEGIGGVGLSGKEICRVYYFVPGGEGEERKMVDVAHDLVSEGLVSVKPSRANNAEVEMLLELEAKAKKEGKGKWASSPKKDAVRAVQYLSDMTEAQKFVTKYEKKPLPAIIEMVKDSMTLEVLLMLPQNQFCTASFLLSGIKFGQDEWKEEAKFFVECRLLQQSDVQVVVEGSAGVNLIGSVLHPRGLIQEVLLKEGFASRDDRSIQKVTIGVNTLLEAENFAYEKRLRRWKDAPAKPVKSEFYAIVTEIVSPEALIVKDLTTGLPKKVFLAWVKAPKEAKKDSPEDGGKRTRPSIFDVPWLFEAREYLRKKLIGKKVHVVVEFTQSARDDYPEKLCCTISVSGLNVAEGLIGAGLASVIRQRQEDDSGSLSTNYYTLSAAEGKANEAQKGIHSKGEAPKYRITDLTGNLNRAKGLLPMLQRNEFLDAIIEYVSSGSRMRLYIPKDYLLVTFLLSGVSCPKAPRPGLNQYMGEKYGEEALQYVRERIMQREVRISIEQCDKAGSLIGWLFVGDKNLALSLVEEGLARVHTSSAMKSKFFRELSQAEETAKEKHLNIWKDMVEEVSDEAAAAADKSDRIVKYKTGIVVLVTPELHVYIQHSEEEQALVKLMSNLRAHFDSNPPSSSYYSKQSPPKKGELCVAKFSEDGEWYRAKVEKVVNGGEGAAVFFVDYGNRETVKMSDLAPLPSMDYSDKAYAHEYALALVKPPPEEYLEDVIREIYRMVHDRTITLNVEYTEHNMPYITIYDEKTKEDLLKDMFSKGLFLVARRREGKLKPLLAEYGEAQNIAKGKRLMIWEYGDVEEDDAREFGLGRGGGPGRGQPPAK